MRVQARYTCTTYLFKNLNVDRTERSGIICIPQTYQVRWAIVLHVLEYVGYWLVNKLMLVLLR
jgi:hypothetical protein